MESARFAENLAIFVEVAQSGSFSAAARQRGMVASSVARQIDALERELGVPLFTRSTRALVRTDAGDLLFARATRILHELNDTRDAVTALEQGVSGLVRVACLPAFGRRHVVPYLGALYAQYPRLSVELVLTERVVDPVVERFDVVIRVGQQADSSLVARCLSDQRYIICATPAYLAQHGRPLHADDLGRHRLIDRGHSTSMRGWRELLTPAQTAQATFALECDDCDARRLSVLQGLGIALMPDWSVGPDIGAGRLVELPLHGLLPQTPGGIYLLRATQHASAKVRAFCTHLTASIGSPPSWQIAMAGEAALA
ncbi:LysR family transcriptional regulator [Cupriavidus necator]|uniref:LysR family transcriptional regulator n=1 Tax=Cupriavidus necator TaxID=106590 RepID=A0A367PCT6_CUPNE|nr:LysR family transcriptional regulator [Cupriavidus necator]QQX86836.1 LysR family transcriptional regulator [Cupriavidus necator]RCJ04826.1 LysR family transcriptional regulator [Cupriavidus necator]